jgi:hypothetical protein
MNTLMKTAVMLVSLALVATYWPGMADAQAPATKQAVQVTCTPATTGSPATSVVVQRENSATPNVWASIGPTTTFSPTVTTHVYVDASRVSNTSYRYQCLFANSAGTKASDPSQIFQIIDPTVPDKGTLQTIIITVPFTQQTAPALQKK